MQISVHPTEKAAAAAVAAHIAARLREKPDLVLGLPTGRTAIPLYRELSACFARGEVDFSRATTFNLDEFVGIGAGHPGSYRQFMQRHLFDRVNLAAERIQFLNGQAASADAECARYEAAIRAAGGLDLQILGIGTNGHIGFNEPARELHARSHRVTLHETTRRSNASLFGGDVAAVPREALSMGMATILEARAILLLAIGKSKARCVERVVNGALTTRLPATFLQLHPRVELVLDVPAASALAAGSSFRS
jgi:glucosamine-6-phosphate deaminase